jgi:DNA invertase Pin-like site-specific DNA recombinase
VDTAPTIPGPDGRPGRVNRRVQSLTNGIIDTTTAHGKLVFGMFALMAEYEAGLARERTQAGLIAASSRGHKGGPQTENDERPHRQSSTNVRRPPVHHGRDRTSCGVTPMTIYRHIRTDKAAAH